MSEFISEFVTECWNENVDYRDTGSPDKPWATPIFNKRLFKKGGRYRCVIISRTPLLYGVFPTNSNVLELLTEEYFNKHFYSLMEIRKVKIQSIEQSCEYK